MCLLFFRYCNQFMIASNLFWISSLVPSRLVNGGDQRFICRLIGISVSPKVGSIHNMGV